MLDELASGEELEGAEAVAAKPVAVAGGGGNEAAAHQVVGEDGDVALGRDVEGRREALAVHGGTVVALDAVVVPQLPVRGDVEHGLAVQAVAFGVGVEAAFGRKRLEARMRAAQGHRVRVGVHEHALCPLVHRDRQQGQRLPAEAGVGLRVPGVDERAVEAVGPAVVAAHQAPAAPVLFHHRVAPVPACVDEAAQRPVVAAHDDHRDPADIAGHGVAGPGEPGERREELPAPAKDRIELEVEDGGVGVGVDGQAQEIVGPVLDVAPVEPELLDGPGGEGSTHFG